MNTAEEKFLLTDYPEMDDRVRVAILQLQFNAALKDAGLAEIARGWNDEDSAFVEFAMKSFRIDKAEH